MIRGTFEGGWWDGAWRMCDVRWAMGDERRLTRLNIVGGWV